MGIVGCRAGSWQMCLVLALLCGPGANGLNRKLMADEPATEPPDSTRKEPEADPLSISLNNTKSVPPLVKAARDGDGAAAKKLIEEGVDLEERGNQNVTALWIAAALGRCNILELLLENGADVEAVGPGSLTALLAASQAGNEAAVMKFIDHGANLEARDPHGNTPLLLAAMHGHPRVVKALLRSGADVDARQYESGISPLWAAAFKGHVYVVSILLKNTAFVGARDRGGATPLFVAAQEGHQLVVAALMNGNADLNAAREDGSTPLHAAAAQCQQGVVELLIDGAANPEIMNSFGLRPVDLLQGENCSDAIAYYNVEAMLRPLFYAAREGRSQIAAYLIRSGLSVHAKLKSNGMTPLHVAAAHGRLAVARVLLARGADPYARDFENKTPEEEIGHARRLSSEDINTFKRLLAGFPEDEQTKPKEQVHKSVHEEGYNSQDANTMAFAELVPPEPPNPRHSSSAFTLMIILITVCIAVFGISAACVGIMGYRYWTMLQEKKSAPKRRQRARRAAFASRSSGISQEMQPRGSASSGFWDSSEAEDVVPRFLPSDMSRVRAEGSSRGRGGAPREYFRTHISRMPDMVDDGKLEFALDSETGL